MATSLYLCRFNENPLHLELLHPCYDDDDKRPKSCWDLEDCLEAYLEDEQQKDNSPDDLPPLCYLPRPDVSFLKCRPPFVSAKESVLGLLEEDEGQPRDLPIHFKVWTASQKQQKSPKCSCSAPHHTWNRRHLDHTATPPQLPSTCTSKNHVHQNNGASTSLPQETPARPREIHWVDCRTASSSSNEKLLPNNATITHFLRSLLGVSLDASPWMKTKSCNDEHDCETTMATPMPDSSDCVILVFSSPMPELLDFRVSDACPSWSLYAVARCEFAKLSSSWKQNATTSGKQYTFPWSFNGDEIANQERSAAHLFIYRKLPIRERLSRSHPMTKEPAKAACLWETRTIYPTESSSDSSAKGNPPPFNEYRMVASPYIDPIGEYPALQSLIQPENLARIQAEAARIPQWTAWPEQQHYQMKKNNDDDDDDDGVAPWHVFPLCYTFPSNDLTKRKWIPLTTSFCPETAALLQKHLGDQLRTALFSRLDPQAVLEAHTGWQDLANYVYRIHLPLKVPAGGLCGTWVDGCVETHEMGRLQAFDDSKIHRAFNYSPTEDRIVLILDLARPLDLPLGTATGGHSDELDQFIERMGGAT